MATQGMNLSFIDGYQGFSDMDAFFSFLTREIPLDVDYNKAH